MHKPDTRTVKVDFVCDRTGKKDTREMPLDEVDAYLKKQDKKGKYVQAINEQLSAIPEDEMPDLVVYFRGKLAVLGSVNPKHDNMISRHLHEITNHESFPAVEVTNKRTRKNTVKENPDA